ncbi:unnamed protein product [marine sediment metagenome]|uniref:Polymerase nucleotidyl transferase domain-containing protein n=1 Tax=marine sediment metagenome TaxID=412755 RepID=X1LPN5_9ZZZZ
MGAIMYRPVNDAEKREIVETVAKARRMLPDPRDFLPMPPWKGPPIPRRVEQLRRLDVAEKFVSTLRPAPKSWYVSGSTSRGDFRVDSDIDITALWEHRQDEPVFEEPVVFGGYVIDLHSFAKDWLVFQYNPGLLKHIFPDNA